MNHTIPRRIVILLLALLLLASHAGLSEGEPGRYASLKLEKTALTISPLTTGARFVISNHREGYEPIQWSIAPESVASIDANTGIITPRTKNGAATVTARAQSGAKVSGKLTIKTIPQTSFILNTKSVVLSPGRVVRFKAAIKPANATYREVTWSLNGEQPGSGSQIDPQTGIFTAGKVEGEQLYVVAATGNGRRVMARVRVQTLPVSSVRFSKVNVTTSIGHVYDLNKILSVLPAGAADTGVIWQSDNPDVATVDEQGMMTTVSGGAVKIRATSVSNPEKRAVCTVKVRYTKVKSIALSATNLAVNAGDVHQMTAQVLPASATYKQLTWASNNESVATVSQSGKITAHGPGVATISATADLDGVSAKLKFRVRGGNMKTIKLSAIGDVVLGGDRRRVPKADDPIGDKMTSYTRFRALFDAHGADYFFKKVASVLNQDDVTIANIESVLTDSTSGASKPVLLRGQPKYREVLARSGVNIGSLANNHAYDFGNQGFNDTRNNLRAVGVKPVGFGSSGATTVMVDGVKVGFVSFQTPADKADVKKAIRTLKSTNRCQIVVVSFHWATSPEWTSAITSAERSLARYAVQCGADLVLGHHKHMVSGIERYKGKMIAYDLGNFLSMIRHKTAAGQYVTKDAMIYQQRFNVFEDGFVEVVAPNILPLMNSETLETFTGQPHIAVGDDAARILGSIRARSPAASRDLVRTIDGY